MRVIAGTHRGRRLVAPPGDATRPTSDRVRESLFSVLGDVSGARVLDLFAGSGALGIEALSRGAASATFVDRAPKAVEAIRRNLEGLGAEAQVRHADVQAILRTAPARGDTYDLVFLDPPYRLAADLGRSLAVTLPEVLAPSARVVTESDRRDPIDLGLPVSDERRYGDTLIRIHDT